MSILTPQKHKLERFYSSLRFIRLFSKGVFNRIDKLLSPEIIIQLYSFTDKLEYTTVPKHKLDDQMNENLDTIVSILPNKIHDLRSLDSNGINLKSITNKLILKNKYFDDKHVVSTDFYMVDDYVISILSVFDNDTLDSYYKLQGDDNLAVSLPHAVIHEYINDLNKLLYHYKQNDVYDGLDFNDTIRKASKNLLNVLGGNTLVNGTYNKLNKISSLDYEGKSNKGKILFCKASPQSNVYNHPNIESTFMFENRIPISNYRHIRKLLEISTDDLYLLSDGNYIVGVGKTTGNYNHDNEDLYIIKFIGYHTWQLNHLNHRLMDVDHDRASLPSEAITYSDFKYRIQELFKDLDTQDINNLYKLILAATRQDRGALIVVSKNARSEAIRLNSQCFLVSPTNLKANMIKSITSIDGAILMDTSGICHGIGVILDGMASSNGDSSRGSRYNSAIRYIETISKINDYSDCMAVVISEDRLIDIITPYTI